MKYFDAFMAEAEVSVVSVGCSPHTHTENHEDSNTPKISNLPTLPYLSKELHTCASNSGCSREEQPTETTKTVSVVFVGKAWSRPSELAEWPIERRQRWGELANQLEDQGIPWPESERQAFEQVKTLEEGLSSRSAGPSDSDASVHALGVHS